IQDVHSIQCNPGPGHRRVESNRESRWAKSETYESHGGITTSSAWASLRLSGSPWVRAMSKRRLAMPLSPVLIMVPSGPTVTLDWVPVVLADAWIFPRLDNVRIGDARYRGPCMLVRMPSALGPRPRGRIGLLRLRMRCSGAGAAGDGRAARRDRERR